MVIGYKPQFVDKILNGTKIHTIREDKHNRWHPGMTMHMATGVRTKNYNQFYEDKCVSVQEIAIFPQYKNVLIYPEWEQSYFLTNHEIETLAKNDGFDTVEDFWEWFDHQFYGKIIHWTNHTY